MLHSSTNSFLKKFFLSIAYFLVAFFTVVSISTLKQVTLHVLLHGIKQILMISDIYIQCCKGFLTLIPRRKCM